MKSEADTVNQYLKELPEDRKRAIEKVREVILSNLPEGYDEIMQYGMISYIIPKDQYPETYNNQPLALVSLGNQKGHMALYMNNIYSDPELREWFVEKYKSTGKRIDMGKSCVRFRSIDNLPLDLVGETISKTSPKEFIAMYEDAQRSAKRRK